MESTPNPELGAIASPACTLVIPALDEADSIERLAALVRRVESSDAFDRVVLVDGGSSDDTVARARSLDIDVVSAARLGPPGPVLGKGDSVWRASDLPGDVLVFRDADVDGIDVEQLQALAMAASRPGIALAKGRFERLQYDDGPARPTSGRITEFVARPLIGLLAPELAHIDEPLSGQFAIRRDVLRSIEVVTRYGVDVGLVLTVTDLHGADAVTTVDIGALRHRAKQDVSLIPMAHDVAATILGLRTVEPNAVVGVGDPSNATPGARAAASAAGASADLGPSPVSDHGRVRSGRHLPCAGPQGLLVVRPPRGLLGTPTT